MSVNMGATANFYQYRTPRPNHRFHLQFPHHIVPSIKRHGCESSTGNFLPITVLYFISGRFRDGLTAFSNHAFRGGFDSDNRISLAFRRLTR